MIYEKVAEALAQQFEVPQDQITMDTNFIDDLQADSLDLVDLVMELEDEYEIEFPEDQIEEFRTVGDVVNYIEENK
ncbi:MAG: acyl carrier protein [Acutalibacteraceae bacterium]|nr:acyl carrier protein [Clostridia bacterium]MEE1144474.1 acyl carrier protein [Acutalibacteraceae bacterium]